jgi:hypothetical protein
MLWVGQFGIVDGEAGERTPWVGAYPDRVRSDDPASVYVLVEPALPGSEEFCEEMKEAIGDTFHRRKVSLTGGLLRALKAAHDHLREWNDRSLREHQVGAGVSCLAVRAQEAYLAQVGPTGAALHRRGAVTRMEPTIPDAIEPLGFHDEFWPHFWRFDLEGDDRLLLLSLSLATSLTNEEMAEDLGRPPEDALPAVYRRARALPNCAALLVAAVPEPAP